MFALRVYGPLLQTLKSALLFQAAVCSDEDDRKVHDQAVDD